MPYVTIPVFATGEVVPASKLDALRTNQQLDPTAIASAKAQLFVATGANTIVALAVGADGKTFKARAAATEGVAWEEILGTPVAKSANFTASRTEAVLYKVDSTSGGITVTLPAASGNNGLCFVIKKMVAANTVTIDPNGAETVDGAATKVLSAQYDSAWIISDGSNWLVVVSGGGGGGTGGAPALTFGTSNTDGVSGTFVETDAAIAIFDATAPSTQAFGDAAAVGSAAFAARRDHKHGMPTPDGGASAFRFHDDDLTASGTSVAMNIPGDTGLTEIVMPYAGSIVAVSVACQNARTAGGATFKPTINGTESTTLSAVLNGTNTQYAYGTQAAGTDTFAAGQRVGVKVTTDGAWAAGTTPSVDVEVWILPAVTPPGGFSTASAQLGADVSMPTLNTYYDGPSVSLAAGTWYVIASVHVVAASADDITAKLWDGTTVISSASASNRTGSRGVSVTCAGFVTPGGTTTYKISAAVNDNSSTMKAAAPVNGVGNNVSWIYAIRIA